MREMLCRSLAATLSQQEVSIDVINSRAVTVAELVADMTQVNDNAFLFCTAVMVDTVTDHPSLACIGSSAFLISTALSNILQRARVSNLDSMLMANISRAVNVVSASCVQSLAIGDAPVSIVTQNLRISAVVTSQEALASGIHLTIAQSSIEKLSGAPAAASRVGTAGVAEGEAVGMSLVQYNNNPLNAFINTTALSVHTTAMSYPLLNRRRLAETVQEAGEYIVLQNKKPIKYIAHFPTEMQVKCITPLEDASYPVRGVCPSGHPFTVDCPAKVKGNFNITCDGLETRPTCNSFDGIFFVKDSRCEVASYTSTNTTCFCRIEADARKRRLQFSDEVITYAATMSLTAIPLMATFVELPVLVEPLRQNALLSSMGAILGLLVVGLLAFGVWDKNNREKASKMTYKDTNIATERTILGFYDSLLPDVFRNSQEPLRRLCDNALMEHHTWLRVLNECWKLNTPPPSPSSSQSALTSTMTPAPRFVEYWVVALGKLLTIFFINSLLATVVYPYDPSCQNFTAEEVCEDQRTYMGLYQACEWSQRSESCGYRGPQLRILHILIYAAIVIASSTVYNRMLDWIFQLAFSLYYDAGLRARFQLTFLWSTAVHSELLQHNSFVSDELKQYDSLPLRILLAARMVKTDSLLSYATIDEETNFIASVRQSDNEEARNKKIPKLKWRFEEPSELTPYEKRCPKTNRRNSIRKKVEQARVLGMRLYQHLQTYNEDESRERLLMTAFCIDSLPVNVQSVAARAMLTENDAWALSYPFCNSLPGFREAKVVMSVVLLVAHFVVQLTLLGMWDRYIVTSNASLWGCVLLTVLVQYYLIQECAVVFLKNVLIEQVLVASKVTERLELLARKSKLILMRRMNLLKYTNVLVQHFNPACRAARSYPHLPVARLLLSIGDHDFHSLAPVKKSLLGKLCTVIVESPLLLFAFVPHCIGELLTDLFVMTLVGVVVFGLYFLGVHYPIVAIIVASAMVGLPLSYELCVRYSMRRKRQVAVAEHDFAMDKFYFEMNEDVKGWREDHTDNFYGTDNDTPKTPNAGFTDKPVSRAGSKGLFGRLHSSDKFANVESTRMAVGASVSTRVPQQRVVVGPPISSMPESHNHDLDEAMFTTRYAPTPQLQRVRSSFAREVRVGPAPSPVTPVSKVEEPSGYREPVDYSISRTGDSWHWRPNSDMYDTAMGGAAAGFHRFTDRDATTFDYPAPRSPPRSPHTSSPNKSLYKDKRMDNQREGRSLKQQLSPPDEFLFNHGLLSELRPKSAVASATSARFSPMPSSRFAMTNSVVGEGTQNNKDKDNYVSQRQMRRLHALRQNPPDTALNVKERHRPGSEVRPPGAAAAVAAAMDPHDATPTTYPVLSWDMPSKYAHVMLVSANAELPAYDILAAAADRHKAKQLHPETLSSGSTSSASTASCPWDDAVCTPMNHTPLHHGHVASAANNEVNTLSSVTTASGYTKSATSRARQHMRNRRWQDK